MNILSLHDVEKSYGSRILFTDVTMTFTNEMRLGLIGVNGTGKSTLLKLIAGQIEPDKGYIERNGKARIYYLPQQPVFNEEESILENIFLAEHPLLKLVRDYEKAQREGAQGDKFMRLLEAMDTQGGWQAEQQAKMILMKLGFVDYNLPVAKLSGGQRRRLALGQALLYPCDLLLLDEPTNHLDEASIEWLESYLANRKGGLLISTHDRYFLDAVCDGIVELSRKHMYRYEGNYETFLALKTEREEMQAATEEKRRQFLKRELEWVRRGALARTTKQKARLQRYERLNAMEKTRKIDAVNPMALKSRLGKTIFDIEELNFFYDDKIMVKDFNYHVVRHDRIGIVGPNGVGKSTFMRLLDDTLMPTSGTTGRGETVRIAHFKQVLPKFDENMRILDYIREENRYVTLSDGSTLSAGQLLERFLFPPDRHGTPIRKLSGGERRRLYLLHLLMSAPNVLLLDEPTNDLDIPTLEVLEEFLDSFTGIVFVVSHDRYFLDRVVDKLFVFNGDGQIELFHGSYSDYKDTVVETEIATKDSSKKIIEVVKVAESVGLTLAEEKEYERIVEELPNLERLLKGLEAAISQIGSDYEQMKEYVQEREETVAKIDALTERWLELEEKQS